MLTDHYQQNCSRAEPFQNGPVEAAILKWFKTVPRDIVNVNHSGTVPMHVHFVKSHLATLHDDSVPPSRVPFFSPNTTRMIVSRNRTTQ